MGIDYNTVQHLLYRNANVHDCDTLCVCCYQNLLEGKFKLPKVDGYKGLPIKNFLLENTTGTYIIRIDGHLTHVRNGVCYDLWDCTNEIIDMIWKVE